LPEIFKDVHEAYEQIDARLKAEQFKVCIVAGSLCSQSFYRAMHFSAKRGIAIACRLSVCPSVRL